MKKSKASLLVSLIMISNMSIPTLAAKGTSSTTQTKQIQSLVLQLNTSKNSIKYLQNLLVQAKQKIDAYEKNKKQLILQTTNLKKQLSSQTNDKTSNLAQIDTLKQQVATLNDDKTKLVSQIGTLTAQINTLSSADAPLKNQVDTLNTANTTLNAQVKDLQTQINTQKDIINKIDVFGRGLDPYIYSQLMKVINPSYVDNGTVGIGKLTVASQVSDNVNGGIQTNTHWNDDNSILGTAYDDSNSLIAKLNYGGGAPSSTDYGVGYTNTYQLDGNYKTLNGIFGIDDCTDTTAPNYVQLNIYTDDDNKTRTLYSTIKARGDEPEKVTADLSGVHHLCIEFVAVTSRDVNADNELRAWDGYNYFADFLNVQLTKK